PGPGPDVVAKVILRQILGRHTAPNTDLKAFPRHNQAFLGRPAIDRPVEMLDAKIVIEHIAMSIELNQRHGSMPAMRAPKLGNGQAGVTASDQWHDSALMHQIQRLLDHGERSFVVTGNDGYVSRISNPQYVGDGKAEPGMTWTEQGTG